MHKLIDDGKLTAWYYCNNHNGIKPAMVLVFDDIKHPFMPIRKDRWDEYKAILPIDKYLNNKK